MFVAYQGVSDCEDSDSEEVFDGSGSNSMECRYDGSSGGGSNNNNCNIVAAAATATATATTATPAATARMTTCNSSSSSRKSSYDDGDKHSLSTDPSPNGHMTTSSGGAPPSPPSPVNPPTIVEWRPQEVPEHDVYNMDSSPSPPGGAPRTGGSVSSGKGSVTSDVVLDGSPAGGVGVAGGVV